MSANLCSSRICRELLETKAFKVIVIKRCNCRRTAPGKWATEYEAAMTHFRYIYRLTFKNPKVSWVIRGSCLRTLFAELRPFLAGWFQPHECKDGVGRTAFDWVGAIVGNVLIAKTAQSRPQLGLR